MRFQGRGAEGSYERLFLAGSMGSESTPVWIGYMSLRSGFLYVLVSSRTLLYKVVINYIIAMSEMSSSVLCIITPWESALIRCYGIVLFYSGL